MESDVQKRIIDYLNFLGAFTIKTISTNKNGIPDIIACLSGRLIAIEVKDKGKKARPLQVAQIRKIRKAGGIAFEADSLTEVKLQLSQFTI